MAKINIKSIAFVLLFFVATTAVAAPPTIKATIDSTTMLMGNKTNVRVTVVKDKTASGELFIPQDTLVKNVEVADSPKQTNTDLGNNREQINYVLPVQSFDPGEYSIPGLTFVCDGDTIVSNSVSLKVLDVDVSELEKNGLYDYKPLEQPESKFWDFLPDAEQLRWLWWTLGALLLIGLSILAYYLYKRWKAGRPILPFLQKKPLLPPYEEAMLSLKELKAQNVWQRGDCKLYYTRLTDIVRRYISRRYEVGAMEMTSSQILSSVAAIDTVECQNELRALLEIADFVKFAKMSPSTDENEQSYSFAFEFVEKNKPVEMPSPDSKNAESTSQIEEDTKRSDEIKRD